MFQTTLPLLHPCTREYSSVHTQQPAKPVREVELDPYILLDDDIKYVTQDIRDVSDCLHSIYSIRIFKIGFRTTTTTKKLFERHTRNERKKKMAKTIQTYKQVHKVKQD